jgi:hypothetical protein
MIGMRGPCSFVQRILAFIVVTFLVAATAFAQPANDNPCNAIALPVNGACVNTAGTLQNATTSTVAAPTCGSGNADVWYTAVVPANGTLTVNTATAPPNGLNDGGMAFYTVGNCATPGSFVEIGCNDNQNFLNSMPRVSVGCRTPGTVVYIRVWRQGGGASSRNFTLCATDVSAGAVNNDPCCATAVPVTNTCNYIAATNTGATNNSSYPAPGCGTFGTGSLDVWFTFVAPASGIAIIESSAGTLTDGAMALYAATSCNGPFTLVQCNDDAGPGLMPFLSFTGLTPGTTYYLRFWGYGTASGTFDLCIHGPTSIPAGQCVYMLQMFDSNSDGWGSSTVGISLNGGAFTTYTVTGTYDIALIGVNIGTVVVVQYTASGPNQAQNSYTLQLLTGGGQIFNSGSPPAPGIAFTQTVTCTPPPAPANDCAGGQTICGGQSFNNNSSGTGNVADLNTSNQGCLASGERQGTWYRFAVSSGGTLGFTIAPVVTTDYDFAVWGPLSSIQCPPVATPLRCSYSALTGNTGIGNGAADVTEGATGDKWVSLMTVTAGQIYMLYIDNFSANGQAFALSWQLGNGASLDCTVLPIELTSFTAEVVRDGVQLDWITATELDNDLFVVERSTDGEAFHTIGTLEGAGTSHQEIHYAFMDRAPLQGTAYYRLKQVDFDGASAYSDVRSVFFRNGQGPLLLVPNPGSDLVRIVMPNVAAGSFVQVMDATGRLVLSLHAASDQILMDTSTLPPGLYSFLATTAEGAAMASGSWVKE